MQLFDAYLMVDWSAAARPRRGADAIWYGLWTRSAGKLRCTALENPSTRDEATAALGQRLARLLRAGRRVLVGFDFPFGYPAGTASALSLKQPPWRHMWQHLADQVEDGADNANNRFAVAETLNQTISGAARPFWGHPHGRRYRQLRATKPQPGAGMDLSERRLVERRVPAAKPVWQLNGNGSVGGQVLMGLPRVLAFTDPRLATHSAVWPFETGLRHDPAPRIVFAEVYPSLFLPANLPGKPKDACQVAGACRHFAALDQAGTLVDQFAGDPSLTAEERRAVECEEAWILGVAGPVIGRRRA